jgi:hypothetical protein
MGWIPDAKDKLPVIKIDIERERKTERRQYEIKNQEGQKARSLWIEGIMNEAHSQGKGEEKAQKLQILKGHGGQGVNHENRTTD